MEVLNVLIFNVNAVVQKLFRILLDSEVDFRVVGVN